MKKIICLIMLIMTIIMVTGCGFEEEERIKLRDLDFTILSENIIPGELKDMIEEKMAEPFMMTYSDEKNLFICVGYGRQNTGGYSITVNDLYLTEEAVYISTSLLGPQKEEINKSVETFPYIVIKTELLDKTVIFE